MDSKQAEHGNSAQQWQSLEPPTYHLIYVLYDGGDRWQRTGALVEVPFGTDYDLIMVSVEYIDAFAKNAGLRHTHAHIQKVNSSDVVEGLPYAYDLAPSGALTTLFVLDGVSQAQADAAEDALYEKIDVASLAIAEIKPLEGWEPIPPLKLCTEWPSYLYIQHIEGADNEPRAAALA